MLVHVTFANLQPGTALYSVQALTDKTVDM
jgi:hypothetical protein